VHRHEKIFKMPIPRARFPKRTETTSPMETFAFAPAYELPRWPFVPPPEIAGGAGTRHPVVIVGGGLAGLTLACDLASRGIRSVLLDEDDTVGVRGASSRGICYAQKSLEIFERLGIYERVAAKGITWSFGRTFSGTQEVYNFNLQTDSVSRQPPFINLQQFYVEWFLVERILELGLTDLRWKSRVTHVDLADDAVRLAVDTPAGTYTLAAEHLIDASGAHSPIRTQLALPAHASRSTDRWCISDVRFKKPLPIERWTWVDAPFNDGRAVWQHLMADGVWRMDYQMAEDCDPSEISRPEVAGARLRKQLGAGVEFEFVWIGPYGYRDHLLERFRHDRIFFIGDAAHVVSPFGARGGNTGIQDAANLAWKLALVLRGGAGAALLDSYDAERRAAARKNLEVTSRSARFLAPRSPAEHTMRRAVVALAPHHAFARGLVNTGRMSVANEYPASVHLPDGGHSVQNLVLHDVNNTQVPLMEMLATDTRCLALWREPGAADAAAAQAALAGLPLRLVALGGESGLATYRAGARELAHLGLEAPGLLLLLRPDAYRAALLDAPTPDALAQTVRTVLALP